MLPLPLVSLSLFLHHLFSALHQNRTSQLHNAVSFLPAETLSTPSFLTSPICLSILPSILPSSSPSLQTVQRFIYILLVETGHVGMHVPVVVADVALCTPIGHRAEPERRREFVGLLELWWGFSGKETTQRK